VLRMRYDEADVGSENLMPVDGDGQRARAPQVPNSPTSSRLARWATYPDALPREIPPGGLISKIVIRKSEVRKEGGGQTDQPKATIEMCNLGKARCL